MGLGSFFRGVAPMAGMAAGGFFGGPAGAAAGGALGSMFSQSGRGGNPSQASSPFLNAVPQHGQQAYNPYIQQGQQADQRLGGEYNDLMQNRPNYNSMGNDPLGYLNQLQSKYEPSAGYQYRKGQLQKDASANAAAGGFRGTQGDVQNQSELINRLMGDDMQQFLANVLGVQEYGQGGQERQYNQGLQGLEGRSNRGYGAAGNLADYLGGNLGQQAEAAYSGRNQQNRSRQGAMNAGMNAFGAAMPGLFGGGQGGGFNPLSGANFQGGTQNPNQYNMYPPSSHSQRGGYRGSARGAI